MVFFSGKNAYQNAYHICSQLSKGRDGLQTVYNKVKKSGQWCHRDQTRSHMQNVICWIARHSWGLCLKCHPRTCMQDLNLVPLLNRVIT